ncbi:MAG: histidine phosphatase family protein [Deltaproteobacteria bacterium]|jgi:probable phosphoglycerate mutase|nr:histidine phosphatase family protein [Deltaproteobacteria bacterium]
MDIQQITRFGLIRHAQTLWNREGRIQGHRDSSLTDSGKKDADSWGQHLKRFDWDRIVGSDLGRAVDTAAIINRHLKIPFEADARLREQDWGEWTAKLTAKIISEELNKLEEAKRTGWQFCPPGGEDRTGVWQRGHDALLGAARKWPGNTILVVTHEGVIKSLIYRLCNRRFEPGESSLIESGHLHWLIIKNSGLQLDQINALKLKSERGK